MIYSVTGDTWSDYVHTDLSEVFASVYFPSASLELLLPYRLSHLKCKSKVGSQVTYIIARPSKYSTYVICPDAGAIDWWHSIPGMLMVS